MNTIYALPSEIESGKITRLYIRTPYKSFRWKLCRGNSGNCICWSTGTVDGRPLANLVRSGKLINVTNKVGTSFDGFGSFNGSSEQLKEAWATLSDKVIK